MRHLCLILAMASVLTFESAHAVFGLGKLPNETRVQFPSSSGEKSIYIRRAKEKFEIGYFTNDQHNPMFEVDSIISVSKFNQGPEKLDSHWKEINGRGAGHRLEDTSNFFLILSNEGLHVLRTTSISFSGAPFVSNLIPLSGKQIKRFETSEAFRFQEQSWVIISVETEAGRGGVYLARLKTKLFEEKVIQISDQFSPVDHVSRASLNDGKVFIGGRTIILNDIVGMNLRESVSTPVPHTNSVSNSHPNELVKTEKSVDGLYHPPSLPSLNGKSEVATNKTFSDGNSLSSTPSSENRKMQDSGEEFVVYNQKDGPQKGVYIQRLSDKKIAKIALENVPLGSEHSYEGFRIEEGILSHPGLARQIDLQKTEKQDFFAMEAKFVPTAAVNIEWLDQEFQDVRLNGKRALDPIPERQSLIDDIYRQIQNPQRSSVVLIGESGDKDYVIQSALKKFPRTWKTPAMDPSVVGADTGISGAIEERKKKLVDISRTVPVIWVAEDFENFQGLGSVKGSPRDLLDMLRADINNGIFKFIGTSYSSENFFNRIKNPSFIQTFKVKEVQNLNPEQVHEYLRTAIAAQGHWPLMDEVQMKYLISTADDIQPVGAEPQRSLDLLEELYSTLEREGRLNAESITREKINQVATQFYRLDPAMRDRKIRLNRLQNYLNVLNQNLIGQENIKTMAYQATQTAMVGIGSRRGPSFSMYVDGPPGTGKTEFATWHAKALGMPLVRIEMNQFKRGSGNGVNELMSQISKALAKNPYSVILFDEIEKADPSVLEGLLAMMDNRIYSYYEDLGEGQKRAQRGSAQNAHFIMTSNAVGDLIREFTFSLPLEKRNLPADQLEKLFFETHSVQEVNERIVEKGIPRPLLDRFNLRKFTFPPTESAMKKILNLKKKALTRIIESRLQVNVVWKGFDRYVDRLVRQAFAENWSTRDTEKAMEHFTGFAASHIETLEHFKENSTYVVDLTRDKDFAIKAQTGGMSFKEGNQSLSKSVDGKLKFELNGKAQITRRLTHPLTCTGVFQ